MTGSADPDRSKIDCQHVKSCFRGAADRCSGASQKAVRSVSRDEIAEQRKRTASAERSHQRERQELHGKMEKTEDRTEDACQQIEAVGCAKHSDRDEIGRASCRERGE